METILALFTVLIVVILPLVLFISLIVYLIKRDKKRCKQDMELTQAKIDYYKSQMQKDTTL